MSDVKIKITLDNADSPAKLKELKQGLLSVGLASTSAARSITTLSHSLQSMLGLGAISNKLLQTASAAINLNKSYENLQIGITALIAANSQNITSQNRAIDAATKWQLAMKESALVIKALNLVNQKTKFSLNEITSAFRMFYATSRGQKGGREKAVQAMESIALAAQATGKELSALIPMMDSLAQGSVIAASEMGQFMNAVGLSNEELKAAAAAGEVYELIIKKLEKFKELSGEAAKSYEVSLNSIKNEFSELFRELSKPLFTKASAELAAMAEHIQANRAEIKQSIETALKYAEVLGKIGLAWGSIKLATLAYSKAASAALAVSSGFNSSSLAVGKFAKALNLSTTATYGLNVAFNLLRGSLLALKRAMIASLPTAALVLAGELMGAIADKFKSAKDSALAYGAAINKTADEISKLSQAQKDLARINLLEQQKANNKEIYELYHKMRFGFLGFFKLNDKERLEAKARIDELEEQNQAINEQIKLYLKKNELASKSSQKPSESLIDSKPDKPNIPDEAQLARRAAYLQKIAISGMDEFEARIYNLKLETAGMLKAQISSTLVDKYAKTELAKIKAQKDEFDKKQAQRAKELAKEQLLNKIELLNQAGEYEKATSLALSQYRDELSQNEHLKATQKAKLQAVYRDKLIKESKKRADELNKAYIKSTGNMQKALVYALKGYQKDLPNAAERGFELASKAVSSLESSLERFFDRGDEGFLKLGKLAKNVFADIGRTLLKQNIIQPLTGSITSLVGGLFGSSAAKSELASLAGELGLKKDSNGDFSGVIDGAEVLILENGEVLKGKNALKSKTMADKAIDALSAINGVRTTYELYQGGLAGLGASVASPFYSAGGFLAAQGFGNAGLFVGGMGQGANAFLTGQTGFAAPYFSQGISAAGVGTLAGSALAGAGVGGLIGTLGDLVFGAQTNAGVGGMIGGALGGALAASLSVPVVGWALAAAGAIIGGMIGKSKISQQGIAVRGEQDLLYSLNSPLKDGLYNWTQKKRKSWFGTSTSDYYDAIDDYKVANVNKTLKGTALLISEFAKSKDIRILRGNYGGNDIVNEGVTMGALEAITGESVSRWGEGHTGYEAFKTEAKLQKKELFEIFAEYATNVKKSLLELKNITAANPARQAQNALEETTRVFKVSMPELFKDVNNAYEVNISEFRAKFKASVQADFSPENINRWREASEALMAARQAQAAYTKSLIEFSQQLSLLATNFYANRGLNSGVFALLNSAKKINALLNDLLPTLGKYDIDSLNSLGGVRSAKAWNSYISSMNYDELNDWMSGLESGLRTQLVAALNEYNASLKQGGLSTPALESLKQITKQIAGAKLAQNAASFRENLAASLELLNTQYQSLTRLKDLALSLRFQADAKLAALNYERALKAAKRAYENGEKDSSAYAQLASSANARVNELKQNAASLNEYKLGVLKISNEVEGISGGADLLSIKQRIISVEQELKKSSDTQAQSLDNLLSVQREYMQNAKEEVGELERLLGRDNPVVPYLQSVIQTLNQQTKAIVNKLANSANNTDFTALPMPDLPRYEANRTRVTANGAVLRDEYDRLINQIYLELFGRSVEQEGLNWWKKDWLAGGWSRDEAKAHIKYAAEENARISGISTQELHRRRGFKPFADGGIVTRPTHALIGEAGYAEAVIPLTNGRGLKIDADGAFARMQAVLERLETRLASLERISEDGAKYLMGLKEMVKNVTNLEGSALLVQGASA